MVSSMLFLCAEVLLNPLLEHSVGAVACAHLLSPAAFSGFGLLIVGPHMIKTIVAWVTVRIVGADRPLAWIPDFFSAPARPVLFASIVIEVLSCSRQTNDKRVFHLI